MRHKISDDVNLNVHLDVDTQDMVELVDKVTDAAITIIGVATAAYVLRRWLTR